MRIFLVILLVVGLAIPVYATDMTAPPVSGEAEALMPEGMPGFGEGLWYIVKSAVKVLRPDLAESARLCLSVVGIAMLVSILNSFSGKTTDLVNMVGVLAVATLLLGTANTLIHIAAETVQEISSYGKLLLPVMTAALAAQGGTASSATLYTGTAFFDSVLGTMISALLIPMVYLFIALVIGYCAIGENFLKQLRDFLKWLVSWSMKTVLYVFTGYISITGLITGGTDKTALKEWYLWLAALCPMPLRLFCWELEWLKTLRGFTDFWL